MNTVAINRVDISHKLEQIPDTALEKVNLYLDSLLGSVVQKKSCSLKGIWQDAGFEKIDNLEAELKQARKALNNTILERKF